MRILLDQNLSPKLVYRLADLPPGLESVYDHELTGTSDSVIFEWARSRELTAIVSADRDFVRLAEQMGPPPKVVRIEQCDFPSRIIEQLLRREAIRVTISSDRGELSCC